MGPVSVPTAGRRVVGGPRRAYLDNLKVTLVAGVITGHVVITYADIGSWAYREPSGNDAFLIPASLFVALGSLFAMGMFFLIAGLLTPRALGRRGARGFLRDRSLRLGLPFLVFLLLVYPAVEWMGAGRRGRSFVWYLRAQLDALDPGPLWFVLALLIFSVGYTSWRAFRPAGRTPRLLRPWALVGLAGMIAVATFVVRLRFPVNSRQVFELHVWQWPQCIGLFVLGIACAENGWLDPVPDRLLRPAGITALVGIGSVTAGFAISHDAFDPFAGGLSWQAALVAACEGVIAVSLSVWLLGYFQRRHDHSRPVASAMGRAAFGAYVVQAPVVVGVALLASPLPAAPELKALVVAPAAVAGSFALARVLTRVPGINRVL